MFIGSHDRTLDDKGRLVLPTNYRRDFDVAGGGVLAPWDRCIALWSRTEFPNVMAEVKAKVRHEDADDDIVRLFQSRAADVQLDAQGRFVLPEGHRHHAGIGREIKVLGQGERIEIWDLGRFEQLEGGKSPDDLSEEIRRLRIF